VSMVTVRPPTEPTLVTSLTQFYNTYGDFKQRCPGGYLHHAMQGFFENGGTAAFIVGLPVPVKMFEETPSQVPLLPPVEGYLQNAAGQRTLRIATSGASKPGEEITVEIHPPEEGAPEGSFNLVVQRTGVEPKTVSGVTMGRGRGQRYVAEVLTRETDNLLVAEVLDVAGTPVERVPAVGSRVTLVPVPGKVEAKQAVSAEMKKTVTPDLFKGDAALRTGINGLEAIEEITLLACPDIIAAYRWGACTEEDVKAVQTAMLNHCDRMKDRFAILDAPKGMTPQGMIGWRKERMNFDSKYGALYYPWIKVDGELVPPSGHIAGVYSRVDAERGVHKAPANEVVRSAIGWRSTSPATSRTSSTRSA